MLLAKNVDALGGDSLSRTKDPEKLVTRMSQIINTMRDLLKLASKHKIDKELFFGDAIERIYKAMGEYRVTRWLEQSCEEDLTEKPLWNKLIVFLEKEVKVQQQKMMLQKSKIDENPREAKDKNDRTRYNNKSFHSDSTPICFICGEKAGESNHIATYGPGGSKIIQYFSCKQFVEKTPAERCSLLRSKGYCIQCLLPGALYYEGKHRDGKCQGDFTCPNQLHHRFNTRKHILVCDEHKDATENNDLLEKYKSRFIVKNTALPQFSQDIRLSFHAEGCYPTKPKVDQSIITDKGIYLLQTIRLNEESFNIFYDTGCDFVISIDAVKRLGDKAIQEFPGPIMLGGVGDTQTESKHGVYCVKLPLCSGDQAVLFGVCLDKITHPFPIYQLAEVEKDISNSAGSTNLPKLPKSVGGKVESGISGIRNQISQVSS